MGIPRTREALEANEWAANDLDAHAVEDLDDEEAFSGTFAAEEAEMGMEFMGLKTAINGGDMVTNVLGEDDEALQVEEMERMMSKLQLIKGMYHGPPSDPSLVGPHLSFSANTAADMGAEMSQAERRRFAAKAVSDLMRHGP